MKKRGNLTIKIALSWIAILVAFLIFSRGVRAKPPVETVNEKQLTADVEELKQAIEEKNKEIKRLEEEAEKYRKAVAETKTQAETLKNEIHRLEHAIGRIRRDISVTEAKIQRTKLEIKKLASEIAQKETSIKKFKKTLAGLIQIFFENERSFLIIAFFQNFRISDFFRNLDYINSLKIKTLLTIRELKKIKKEFEEKKISYENKKNELASLNLALAGRKKAEEAVKDEKTNLLKATRNEEKKYQALLQEREKRRKALEQEIREIENRIRVIIDPASLPKKGSGVLGFPLPKLDLKSCWQGGGGNCITQFFGRTSFALAGGYNGQGHNGVDFRADIGTPVLAAEDGIIEAVGDTDKGCRGVSYGKWILIRHSNNLATLYAHLSSINVSAGREVARGEVIGYSGKTGYATGPHLHFTVFAARAVRIKQIRSRVCGTLMTLPLSATKGYINPLDYL